MDNKLILVDGLPGSGKTTTCQWLNRVLKENSISSQWYYELAHNHPIKMNKEENSKSTIGVIGKSLSLWSDLTESINSNGGTVVVDSVPFQVNVLPMMNLDLPGEQIAEYFDELEKIIVGLKPFVIYFSPKSVTEHITRTYDCRGHEFKGRLIKATTNCPYSIKRSYTGLDGSISYWRDYKARCDRLFNQLNVTKIEIDGTFDNWGECHSKILKALDIPQKQRLSVLHKKIVGFEGVFKKCDSGVFCNVKRAEDGLVISNLVPNLEKKSVLIRLSKNIFEMRGHDIQLNFQDFDGTRWNRILVHSSWSIISGLNLVRRV